jgi:hypothetical protein
MNLKGMCSSQQGEQSVEKEEDGIRVVMVPARIATKKLAFCNMKYGTLFCIEYSIEHFTLNFIVHFAVQSFATTLSSPCSLSSQMTTPKTWTQCSMLLLKCIIKIGMIPNVFNDNAASKTNNQKQIISIPNATLMGGVINMESLQIYFVVSVVEITELMQFVFPINVFLSSFCLT